MKWFTPIRYPSHSHRLYFSRVQSAGQVLTAVRTSIAVRLASRICHVVNLFTKRRTLNTYRVPIGLLNFAGLKRWGARNFERHTCRSRRSPRTVPTMARYSPQDSDWRRATIISETFQEPEEPEVRRATEAIRNLDYARSASRWRGRDTHLARVLGVVTPAEGQKNFDRLYSAAVVLTADACPSRWYIPSSSYGAERSGAVRSGVVRKGEPYVSARRERVKEAEENPARRLANGGDRCGSDVPASAGERKRHDSAKIRTSRRCPKTLGDVDDPGTMTTFAVELIDSAITGSFQDVREWLRSRALKEKEGEKEIRRRRSVVASRHVIRVLSRTSHVACDLNPRLVRRSRRRGRWARREASTRRLPNWGIGWWECTRPVSACERSPPRSIAR